MTHAALHYRKGGLRILVGATVLWAAFWGWTYYDAASSAAAYARAYSEDFGQVTAMRGGPRDTPENRAYFDGRLLEDRDLQGEQIARRDKALRVGLGGLGILAIMLLIGAWDWRRQKAP